VPAQSACGRPPGHPPCRHCHGACERHHPLATGRRATATGGGERSGLSPAEGDRPAPARHRRNRERHAEASAIEARNHEAKAEAERVRAVAAADKASRVSEFLGGIFEAADPLGLSGYGAVIPKATGETLTVRELLNRGAARIDFRSDTDARHARPHQGPNRQRPAQPGGVRPCPALAGPRRLQLREKHLASNIPETV